MDLSIEFGDKTIITPVYVKMDAHDQLLLSEGVCRQLEIVKYHPDVQVLNSTEKGESPPVRVQLIHSVLLQPYQSAVVPVKAVGAQGTHLLEPSQPETSPLEVRESVLEFQPNGRSGVLITNNSGQTYRGKKGTELGHLSSVSVTEEPPPHFQEMMDEIAVENESPRVAQIYSDERVKQRKQSLQDLFEGSLDHLPEEERDQLIGMLMENHHAFCLEKGERGETDLVQCTIDTPDACPQKQPMRRVPFGVRHEMSQQLDQMLTMGVIQPSESPWASPVVLVRKKDGSLRFCIDYQKLNSVTKPDVFPMPRIDDMLDQLGKSKYFSTLDLAAGYWQIRMEPSSQEKTAFIVPQGLYEFRVMPFGLMNAPATFQRMMQKLEEHLRHLQLVINEIQAAGLKLKPTKCSFVREEVNYLGHVITSRGLSPNPARIAAIQHLPAPTDLKRLRQFLGLASYYRRFIPNFAKIAAPLHALTKKLAPFEWTGDCQEAFDQLRKRLMEAPVLAYPNFEADFVLETDASIEGVGGVLVQTQDDGKLHPVAYASRALSPAERNYSITELETLAVVWAVTHFRYYLYGHNVTIFTDHSAVKSVLSAPQTNGKHARWWSKVYGSGIRKVEIVYRSGKENANADALSRQPHLEAPQPRVAETETQVSTVRDNSSVPETVEELLRLDTEPRPATNHQDSFVVEQRKDPDLLPLIQYMLGEKQPEDPSAVSSLASRAKSLTVINGVLHHLDPVHPDRQQTVVPTHLRQSILEDHHGGKMSGHFSGPRIFKAISRTWWWEGLHRDAMTHARNCPSCMFGHGSGRTQRPPLEPIPVQRPFQIWGVDIVELPRTRKGNCYAIVFQDFFTKWPLVFPAQDQKSLRIARLLTEQLIPMFGVPEALLSDRGANLLSNLMMDLCASLGICKLNTTSYHPQCNGMVERFNRTLIGMLRAHAAKFGTQWDQYLPGVLWAYRNTPHESTGEKPSFLMYGIDCRSPTEATFLPTDELQPTDVSDYREELMLSLTSARSLAQSHIRQAQRRYKTQHDKHIRVTTCQVGDWILIRFPHEESGKNRKLARPWHGPYRVTELEGPDLTAVKVYFPQEKTIRIHRSRVQSLPTTFPAGYYYYGSNQHGPGHYPKWIDGVLGDDQSADQVELTEPRYHLRSHGPAQGTARVEPSLGGE